MSLSTDCVIKHASCHTVEIQYRAPIKFGGRVVRDATLLEVEIEVETRDGRRGVGRGSMPLGNVWAWPSTTCSTEQTLRAMIDYGTRAVELASSIRTDAGHPLQLTTDLAQQRQELAAQIAQSLSLPETLPKLATMVAASPLDAAIFDAHGKALGQNAYNLLSAEFISEDLKRWLGAEFQGEYLDRYTRRVPQPQMPLYHLVGALDPLDTSELQNPIGDGLPETLADWIPADGLTHLKIKLNGDDLDWDTQRVAAVERVAAAAQLKRQCEQWQYSLDFNEKCQDVEYVLEFLRRLQRLAPAAYRRVQYIEQPTHRDLAAHRENRMQAAAQFKPVVIDESLVDLASLELSRELGYSGVALKACKGHGEALLMGAAAQKHGLFLCVQDLTCPGASFLHSASLAARIPTVAAIEGNGRQYCPAGNRDWQDRYPSMFHITTGQVGTGVLTEPGLGWR